MESIKKDVIRILRRNGFLEYEYENVFSAMSEILDVAADQLEIDEPNAVNTISRYRDVSNDISDMNEFCGE